MSMNDFSSSMKLQLTFYVPLIALGIFAYLFLGQRLLRKPKHVLSAWTALILLWWYFGAMVGYVVSLLSCYLLFFLAGTVDSLSWIPATFRVNDFCFVSLIVSCGVYGIQVLLHFFLVWRGAGIQMQDK
jgi:hypothetical protein